MQTGSLLILIALIASITAPVCPSISGACNSGMLISTLDVCDNSGPSLSVNSELLSLYESPYIFFSPGFSDVHKSTDRLSDSFLIAFQKERPPRF